MSAKLVKELDQLVIDAGEKDKQINVVATGSSSGVKCVNGAKSDGHGEDATRDTNLRDSLDSSADEGD
ncbi:hypothetical protein RIF29_29214 [Crotalaria pallida]|uniref:Uncharacterized protein n=1 Tax=Crotalaria pallida TaxID=3830 RepID=A0AAN9EE63_CROPI